MTKNECSEKRFWRATWCIVKRSVRNCHQNCVPRLCIGQPWVTPLTLPMCLPFQYTNNVVVIVRIRWKLWTNTPKQDDKVRIIAYKILTSKNISIVRFLHLRSINAQTLWGYWTRSLQIDKIKGQSRCRIGANSCLKRHRACFGLENLYILHEDVYKQDHSEPLN